MRYIERQLQISMKSIGNRCNNNDDELLEVKSVCMLFRRRRRFHSEPEIYIKKEEQFEFQEN